MLCYMLEMNRLLPINSPSFQNILNVLAVFAFLLVNVGDIHSHMCLDGQEPAVSVHFENLNGHPEHVGDEQEHNDIENEIALKSLKSKTSDLSKLFLSASTTGIPSATAYTNKVSSTLDEVLLPQKPANILPPLRAPPELIS
jgi:hypothetical protein